MRVVVESLAEEFDPMDVAAAAVKLAQAASEAGQGDEEEIPVYPPREREHPTAAGAATAGAGAAGAATPKKHAKGKLAQRGTPTTGARFCRLFIGAGRQAKIRPGDLVGAIANEAGVAARTVGAIQIGDSYSLVEVVEEEADRIIEALRASTIKGRRVTVRRER